MKSSILSNGLSKQLLNIMERKLALMVQLLPIEGVGFMLLNPDGKHTSQIIKLKNTKDDVINIMELDDFLSPYITSQKELFLDKLPQDLFSHSDPQLSFISSIYGKRINNEGETKSLLYVFLREKEKMTADDAALFDVFSESLENHLHHEEVKQATTNIQFDDKFKYIFDFLPEAISFHELPSHKTIAVNKAFIKYSGYSEDEISGKTGLELNLWYHDEERKQYREILSKEKYIKNFEAQFINKQGDVFYGLISSIIVELSGKVYLLVVIRNIDQIKKAQSDIVESEKKFKMFFNSLPDNLSINRISDSTFVEVNDFFLESTGLTKEEVIGKSGYELGMWASEDERENYIHIIKEQGGVKDYRFQHKSKNGELIHALISSTTIHLNGEPHLLVVTKNISNLIKTKEELKASEEKFKLIFQSSPDAININRYVDEVFVDVNDSFLRQTGYTRDELIGNPLYNFPFWKKEDDLAEFIRQLNESGKIHNFETQFITKEGVLIDSLVSASISYIEGEPHIITITRNITELKRIQSVLKQSENRFRTIVEKSHASIFILNNNYQFVYTNPRSSELFGYSKSELENRDLRTIVHPDSMNLVLGNYIKRQQMQDVPEQYEFKIIRKDQQVRDVEARSSVFIDIQGEIRTVAQLLDITDIKKAKAKAEEQATKAQNYLDISVVFMLALNLKGEIVMVNHKACEILEYSEQELMGMNWFDHFIPETIREKTKKVFQEAVFNENFMGYYENEIVSKSGGLSTIAWHNTLVYDSDGHVSGTLSSGEDITEELKNYQLLKESENRYRTIFDANLDGMAIFDSKGRIVEANEVISQLYGYSYEELLNRNSPNEFSIVSGYDIRTIKKYLKANKVFQTELEDVKKDGSIFVINAKIREIVYNNSTHYLVIIRDITDKKKDELLLIEAKEKAEESDELKSAFLANMSHEIRTPMNAIIGFSSLLDEEDLEESEKKDFIARIRNNSTSLLGLINDIIDISKIEANQIDLQNIPFDLNAFMLGLESVFELQAEEKGVHLSVNIVNTEQEYILNADENRLRQIMINLLANAMKFTSKDGTIEFGYTTKKKHVTFYVKDTGIGITKTDQKLIFNRFRQASLVNISKYGGTGLGLSISKGLVDIMGGQMWLESKIHKGATFFFSIPIKND